MRREKEKEVDTYHKDRLDGEESQSNHFSFCQKKRNNFNLMTRFYSLIRLHSIKKNIKLNLFSKTITNCVSKMSTKKLKPKTSQCRICGSSALYSYFGVGL